MDRQNVTNDDEGKRVVNFNGEKIGVVSGVDGDEAHVAPDAGLSDAVRSKLGWNDMDEDDHVLTPDRIQTVTNDEVRLKDEA